MADSTQAN
jgi:hypothetical protein